MTIRPVDLQTMIPKLPELQKARNVENEIEKNNLNINIHKEQQQQEKNAKHVTETKRAGGSKIDREGKHNGGKSKQEKEHKEDLSEDKGGHGKETKGEFLTKIDIRI